MTYREWKICTTRMTSSRRSALTRAAKDDQPFLTETRAQEGRERVVRFEWEEPLHIRTLAVKPGKDGVSV